MLFFLGFRSAGDADQVKSFDDVFVRFAHVCDAAAGQEGVRLDRLASHFAIHSEQRLRDRSGPFGEFLVAQVAVLLDETAFAC